MPICRAAQHILPPPPARLAAAASHHRSSNSPSSQPSVRSSGHLSRISSATRALCAARLLAQHIHTLNMIVLYYLLFAVKVILYEYVLVLNANSTNPTRYGAPQARLAYVHYMSMRNFQSCSALPSTSSLTLFKLVSVSTQNDTSSYIIKLHNKFEIILYIYSSCPVLYSTWVVYRILENVMRVSCFLTTLYIHQIFIDTRKYIHDFYNYRKCVKYFSKFFKEFF